MRRRAEVVIPRGMVTSAPANAKERRRLKREAERQQDGAPAAKRKEAERQQDGAPAAKRKEAERQQDGAPAAERRKETGESEAEGLRRRDPKTAECDGKETARERRRAKRAAERDDDDDDDDDPKKKKKKKTATTTTTTTTTKEGLSSAARDPKKKVVTKKAPSSGAKAKAGRSPLVAFVGQLSYSTTGERLREFFQVRGVPGEVAVRLLTDAKGKSKGTAFVECASAEALHACVALHHAQLDGRRINVEKSAGGGKKKRRETIDHGRDKQQKVVETTVNRVVDEYLRDGRLRPGDVDDGVRALLARRSGKIAEKALEEFCNVEDRHQLDNPPAYLTKIVTRLTDEDDEEEGHDHDAADKDAASSSKGWSKKTPPLSRKAQQQTNRHHQQKSDDDTREEEKTHRPPDHHPEKKRNDEETDDPGKAVVPPRPGAPKKEAAETRGGGNDHDLADIFPALRARRKEERPLS